MSCLGDSVKEVESWLLETSLPLWRQSGFDSKSGLFEEQLSFELVPVTTVPRRLMVQARQVATFAAAALSGRDKEAGQVALIAGRAMIRNYWNRLGDGTWIFSIGRQGQVADSSADLYAHAFALFGLAWLLKLEPEPLVLHVANATLDTLDGKFADISAGGYWDRVPRADNLRRQNPHMHLFEAYLSLYDATGREDVLARACALYDLAVGSFFNHETGALCECFDDHWNIHPATGAGCVEPGHLFEWAALLRQFELHTGDCQERIIAKLLRFAVRWGLESNTGRVIDEVGEHGEMRLASSRLWPHLEAIKALSSEQACGADYSGFILSLVRRLQTAYCKPDLRGGWIDHLDCNDTPISRLIPASSLYHIYFAVDALLNAGIAAARDVGAVTVVDDKYEDRLIV